MRGRVFLALGSNMGNRSGFLEEAKSRLTGAGVVILRQSNVLDNAAILLENQPDFLNQVVEVDTQLNPRDLLSLVKKIEKDIGRSTVIRYGPREIDIDILAYPGVRLDAPDLVLPHPGLHSRDFIRVLLKDLGETPESVETPRGPEEE
ncbi:MAG: 2-amino-4-hydroxy-6-hydroxymethyldihydropteridine diphosphokinase [Spirochaetia bacterium]|nr:2-amino-4-hydroxy-6-hydroxymethyldihydropteridine diphosphokinase [Spirochaetia bacterium]